MVRDELKAMSIAALKSRDKETRAALSGVLAEFTAVEKSGKFTEWTEEAQRDLVAKYVKKLKSSLKDLQGTDLGAAYAAEAALLEPYTPKLLDEAATRALVEPLVGQVKGIGPLMGRIMKTHKGKVDPGLVRRIAVELGI
ncbi:MAG: GatB/YqeY domain-containing protein [Deltaproteobacteria bacterium]|nr:GatB/YqeY domain-containing protein [Deltaproteobacteria bacterium]